jgi:4-hydroxy-2-oxoheptanedioate aldolase
MSQTLRLNNVIRALEQGHIPITAFSPPSVESAIALSTASYDGIIFEAEHNPYDITTLRDCLQYMLNRRQIVERGTLAPAVTPIIRIPANGGDMNQWLAKQVLDIGAYGVAWPRVSTVEQAYNAVAACRYPRPQSADA